jgi:hypothetical protein
MKRKEKIFTIAKNDFDIQTFPAGGPGGQHQNKTDSACRITHRESGAVGECRNHRSQHQNKREAMKRLTKSQKFKLWVQRRVFEITGGKTIDQLVSEQMDPNNIQTEIRVNGRYTIVDDDNQLDMDSV